MTSEASAVEVQYIGWDHDIRYAEEKARVTQHIQDIAQAKSFTYALVQ